MYKKRLQVVGLVCIALYAQEGSAAAGRFMRALAKRAFVGSLVGTAALEAYVQTKSSADLLHETRADIISNPLSQRFSQWEKAFYTQNEREFELFFTPDGRKIDQKNREELEALFKRAGVKGKVVVLVVDTADPNAWPDVQINYWPAHNTYVCALNESTWKVMHGWGFKADESFTRERVQGILLYATARIVHNHNEREVLLTEELKGVEGCQMALQVAGFALRKFAAVSTPAALGIGLGALLATGAGKVLCMRKESFVKEKESDSFVVENGTVEDLKSLKGMLEEADKKLRTGQAVIISEWWRPYLFPRSEIAKRVAFFNKAIEQKEQALALLQNASKDA